MIEKPMTATDFEAAARDAGLSIAELCRRANVPQSSFHRWKAGGSGITLGTYSDLVDVLLAADIKNNPSPQQPADPAKEA